jgi:hypothetical protein
MLRFLDRPAPFERLNVLNQDVKFRNLREPLNLI